MSVEIILPVSLTMGFFAWALVLRWYLHPLLRSMKFAQAMRPLLLLHAFRYIGLMFLVPGVTAEALDVRFAAPAAYGDLVAAVLALGALAAFRLNDGLGVTAVWVFNVWGFGDLLNAVARGLLYTPDGALGATFWIPALIVPLLLVTHVYIFVELLRRIGGGRRVAGANSA